MASDEHGRGGEFARSSHDASEQVDEVDTPDAEQLHQGACKTPGGPDDEFPPSMDEAEQVDGPESADAEQFRQGVCQMLAGEMQQMVRAFAADQRARMDMHLCEVERLVSDLPNRLQGVASVPLCSTKTERELAVTWSPTTRSMPEPRYPRRLSQVSSMGSCLSSVESTTKVMPKKSSSLSVRQEYVQMKTHVFRRSRGQRLMASLRWWLRRRCPCRNLKMRYYLPLKNMRNVVHGSVFGNISLGIIFANLIFTVILSDQELQNYSVAGESPVKPLPMWFHTADIVFLVFFTVELLMRLLVEEVFFFVGEHWKWNLLDLIVVVSTAIDALSYATGPHLSFVRIIRLLRVVKSVKVLRIVRYCDELRVMMLQIMNSIAPMVWAFTFLGLVILMFALAFTQGVISYLEEVAADRIPASNESDDLKDLFNSFLMSLLSLFMSISGGINWWMVVKPLLQVSPIYVTIYLCYILVLMIGVLNIIIGIFVDTANDAAVKDREALAREELEKNLLMMKGLEELFDELDEDKKGVISRKRFEELSRKNEVRALFATMDLDVSHANEVFKLFDMDGDGGIAVDEFVVGIMRSKGLAKRTDVHGLMCEITRMLHSLRKHQRWVAERFQSIDNHVTSFTV